MQSINWQASQYSFFSHTQCEFFPCHKGVPAGEFNCLFCYCPLYFLGKDCGGGFTLTANGVKDCSACTFPHRRENYPLVLQKLKEATSKVKFE